MNPVSVDFSKPRLFIVCYLQYDIVKSPMKYQQQSL